MQRNTLIISDRSLKKDKNINTKYTDAGIDELIKNFLDYLRFEVLLSKNTLSSYSRDLKKFKFFLAKNNIKNCLEISHEQILIFLESLYKNLKESSISRILSSLRTFYKFLVREEMVKRNPFSQIKNPKKPQKIVEILSEEEVKNFLESIPYSKEFEVRDRAMFELLYSSGLRVSELVNLKLCDVDFDENLIRFIGKGNKERITPIGKISISFLKKYLKDARNIIKKRCSNDYIFLNKSGGKISRQGFWKILKKYAKRINLGKNLYPHIFRHSFATHMLKRGADLRTVQELLGHRDISTTEIYTNLDKRYIKNIYFKYHPREKKINEKI